MTLAVVVIGPINALGCEETSKPKGLSGEGKGRNQQAKVFVMINDVSSFHLSILTASETDNFSFLRFDIIGDIMTKIIR